MPIFFFDYSVFTIVYTILSHTCELTCKQDSRQLTHDNNCKSKNDYTFFVDLPLIPYRSCLQLLCKFLKIGTDLPK